MVPTLINKDVSLVAMIKNSQSKTTLTSVEAEGELGLKEMGSQVYPRRQGLEETDCPFSHNRILLLLSHFSRVQLCASPQMAAHQAPPSLEFSRQEHWSGLPFPSPVHESEKGK